MKTLFRSFIVATLVVALLGGLWIASPTRGEYEAQSSSWTVQVYNGVTYPPSGAAVCSGAYSGSIAFSWTGAPDTIPGVSCSGGPVDNYSVRFTTSVFFPTGNYTFTASVDDGIVVTLDNSIAVINDWGGGGLHTVNGNISFSTDANHAVTVDFKEVSGTAQINLTWALSGGGAATTTTGVPWYAEFFNNLDLAGTAVFTTTYGPSGLSQNWGQGSPGGSVPVDNFSARFTRSLNVPTDMAKGIYQFYVKADDNFRFWVDSTLLLDKWNDYGASQTHQVEVTLLDGPHTLKLEYKEQSVDAFVFLTWTPPNAQNPVLNPDGTGGTTSGTPVPGVTGTPAQTGVIATVTANVLNFRSAPSATASVITQLKKGQSYPVTGKSSDEKWLQLLVNGQLGWVMAQYVSLSGDLSRVPVVGSGTGTAVPSGPTAVPAPTNVRGKVLGNLIIRNAPSRGGTRIGLMPWGTVVPILGRDQGHAWYNVDYNGLLGWAYAPWIQIVEGTFDSLPYTDGSGMVTAPDPTTGVIVQAYGNMRVRSGPGFQYPKINKVVWGTRVQVLARSTDGRWYKIQYGPLVGWSYATWFRPVQGDVTTVPVSDQ